MANTSTNRGDLLKAFIATNKRRKPTGYKPQKGKPAGLQGYQPMPTGGQNARFKRLAEDDNPNTRTIPGFGGYRQQREQARVPHNDDSVPRFRSSTPKQRAPYRPGQRNKRRYPAGRYDRWYATRPHRPKLD